MNCVHFNNRNWIYGYNLMSKKKSLDLKIFKEITFRINEKDRYVGRQRNQSNFDKRSRKSKLYKSHKCHISLHIKIYRR